MGSYYYQADTFNSALAKVSDLNRSGHYFNGNVNMYRYAIQFTSSSGHTFYVAKQLTVDGQGVPNGVVTSAYFDDVPADKMSGKYYYDCLVDKEFYGVTNSVNTWLQYNAGTVVDYNKLFNVDYPYCANVGGGPAGFNGDATYPYCYRGIYTFQYYKKYYNDLDESNRIAFLCYDYYYIISGEQGFYSVKYSYAGVATSISGAYVKVIVGPPGVDGADGADGVNGVDGLPGADGADAPIPDLTNIESALLNLSKLSKYDDMVTAFGNLEKIVNSLCALMSNTARVPADLNFTDNKNADNLVTKSISVDFTALNTKLTDLFTDTLEGGETVKIGHLVEAVTNIFNEYSNEVSIVGFLKKFFDNKAGV